MIIATISENLQTIKSSTDAIKQAIIDKGDTISGDITTCGGCDKWIMNITMRVININDLTKSKLMYNS